MELMRNFFYAVCKCNHLTHFGLLLRPSTSSENGLKHATPLRLITMGGCGISALALILTVAFLIYLGKVNGCD